MLKNFFKFFFLHLVTVFAAAVVALFIASWFKGDEMFFLVVAAPSIVGLIGIPVALAACARKNWRRAAIGVFSTLICSPVGMWLSYGVLYGIGMSSVGNMRY